MSNAINVNNVVNKNDPYIVSALFFIRGENLDPNEATDRLGLSPITQHKKGDQHGEKREMTWKSSLWAIDTKTLVTSQVIEHHIVWILDRLEKVKVELEDIRSKGDVYIELEIIISIFRRNWNETITSKTMNRLCKLNIPLGFSVSYMAYDEEE